MRAALDLQGIAGLVPIRKSARVFRAMRLLEQIGMDMRRKAIFAAGAKARKPVPIFDGERLGSMESIEFYDGFKSTHPDFRNPYRGE